MTENMSSWINFSSLELNVESSYYETPTESVMDEMYTLGAEQFTESAEIYPQEESFVLNDTSIGNVGLTLDQKLISSLLNVEDKSQADQANDESKSKNLEFAVNCNNLTALGTVIAEDVNKLDENIITVEDLNQVHKEPSKIEANSTSNRRKSQLVHRNIADHSGIRQSPKPRKAVKREAASKGSSKKSKGPKKEKMHQLDVEKHPETKGAHYSKQYRDKKEKQLNDALLENEELKKKLEIGNQEKQEMALQHEKEKQELNALNATWQYKYKLLLQKNAELAERVAFDNVLSEAVEDFNLGGNPWNNINMDDFFMEGDQTKFE